MTGQRPVVIIGGGHAGFHAALAFREQDRHRPVIVVDGEVGPPYQRPPLSKAFLKGELEVSDLQFRPASFYAEAGIQLVTGATVRTIDRTARCVVLGDGNAISYSHLILATGSRHRQMTIPGHQLDGIVGLRSVTQAVDLRTRLRMAQNIVIIGGGFIGLEVASVAAEVGKKVVLFEAQARLMSRSVTDVTSEYFHAKHTAAGVDLRLTETVEAVEGDGGEVRAAISSRGTAVPADLIVFGVGAIAADELAAQAGLTVDQGVLVDQYLQTSDPDISAIGDCARFPSRRASDPTIRLESIQNAVDQAKHVASRLANGSREPYAAVPWFATEQAGSRLQIVGLPAIRDHVEVVGSADRFSVYSYAGEALIGCESVNAPRDHVQARKALTGDRTALAEIPRARTTRVHPLITSDRAQHA